MVSRIEIDYKTPLKSGDSMISCINLKREGARFVFVQDIYRAADKKVVIKAVVNIISVVNGKLTRGEEFAEMFAQYL